MTVDVAISSLSLSAVDNHRRYYLTGHINNISLASPSNCTVAVANATIGNTHCMLDNDHRVQQRYELLTDADVQVCHVPRGKNIIDKIRFSHHFCRWENHHISLEQSEIISTTNKEYMDRSISYSSIENISVWSKLKMINFHRRFGIRIVTNNRIYFFQINTVNLRDRLFYSIKWRVNKLKFECTLRSTHSPQVLLKEMTNMIDFTMKSPIEDVEVQVFPLEIISEILQQQQFNLPDFVRENAIESLSTLLVKHYPTAEMCDFFSRYCRDNPRSEIVIEMFTPTIQKILKHNTDFAKCPRMRLLVQEYILALNSQNDGLRIVEHFVKRMHAPMMISPFMRVLSNLISVCLAGIYQFFQDRKKFCFENKENSRAYEENTESQLVCYTNILQLISTFYDWRHHLGLVLQPVPFLDEALTHNRFIEILKNVIKNLVEDTRCEVHKTVLGIRQGKDGWLEMFCLNGIVCNDNGETFSLMLDKLISCCCRRKTFLLSINKLFPSLLLLALRERQSSLNILSAMLDFDAIENHDDKLQLILTLKSTPSGLKVYEKVCERQRELEKIQQKSGPRELTLPSHSIDSDLARLLSTGSFGNLESLSLICTNVTSACAEHLIKLPALKKLNLSSTRFGDAGLELICEHLNQLEELNLSETPVTNKGLTYLAHMKTLRYLNLSSMKLSALAIEILKENLPALKECDTRYTEPY